MDGSHSQTIHESLIEFVELAGRIRFKPDEIARELHSLAKRGADWPKASVRQWKLEIEKALSDGRLGLDENGQVVSASVKALLDNSPTAVQLLLF